jgi:citrate lyase beta subunit
MYQSWTHPTLYMPGTDLDKLVERVNSPGDFGAHRIVMCTEDAVKEDDVPWALANIGTALNHMCADSPVCVYVRARNPEVLGRLLELPHIGKITGFVIPKAGPRKFCKYADQVAGSRFLLMPIMESRKIRDSHYRRDLRDVYRDKRYRSQIDCLRIGGNDLMGHLGLRRPTRDYTIYDTSVGGLIFDLVNEFAGLGKFKVSAPVFECFGPVYDQLLAKEVLQHVVNGLFGQTIIHSRHLRLVRDLYKVSARNLSSAQETINTEHAVVGNQGRMDEVATHSLWARRTIKRWELFGDDESSRTGREIAG